MATHTAKVTFTRGEITPLAQARRDIEMYQAGAKSLLNFQVLKEGGIRRRSGTKYLGAAKYADKDTRLVDFDFSSSQTFAIEMGDEYTRFWTAGGQVLSGGDPYEIVSPFAEADLRAIQWAQSFDTMYFVRQSTTLKPQKLVRTSNIDWAWSDMDFYDGPYLPINDQVNTVTPSTAPVTGSNPTLTFSTLTNINGGAGFRATDVGRHIRVQHGGGWSWGKITSVSSPKIVVANIVAGSATGTTASLSWRLGAFSDTTGYPGAVGWFQSRMFFAGTPDNPRFIAYSRPEDPEDMSPSDFDGTVADDHGGTFILLGKGDGIQWLQEATRLQIGTTGAIRSLGPTQTSTAFGPRNVSQQIEAAGGVSSVTPIVVGSSTLHTTRFNNAIEDAFFDLNTNSLATPRITNLAEHMFDEGVKEMWFQQEPNFQLWTVLNDGTLTTTTLERYEKVVGFARQELDGGNVISACTIAGSTQDDLYLVVRRTINSTQVQYIELLQPRFLRADKEDAWFVDCGGQYDDVATNTVSGATWLANTTVSILADGVVVPQQTISAGGVLTLPNDMTASKITFGIPIETSGELLEPPIDTPEGSAKGRKMRVFDCYAHVYETLGLKFVSDKGRVDNLLLRPNSTLMGSSPDLVSDTRKTMIDGSWSSKGVISFLCDQPLPCTILALNVGLDYEP